MLPTWFYCNPSLRAWETFSKYWSSYFHYAQTHTHTHTHFAHTVDQFLFPDAGISHGGRKICTSTFEPQVRLIHLCTSLPPKKWHAVCVFPAFSWFSVLLLIIRRVQFICWIVVLLLPKFLDVWFRVDILLSVQSEALSSVSQVKLTGTRAVLWKLSRAYNKVYYRHGIRLFRALHPSVSGLRAEEEHQWGVLQSDWVQMWPFGPQWVTSRTRAIHPALLTPVTQAAN